MGQETSGMHLPTIASKIMRISFAGLSGANGVAIAEYNNLLTDAKTLASHYTDETPGFGDKSPLHRLKIEHAQLVGKMDALTLFLGRDLTIDEETRGLLQMQLSAMTVYEKVLTIRLNKLAQPKVIPVASAGLILGEAVEVGGDRNDPIPFDC